VEVDWDEESVTWMTSTRKYTATFATACQINYERTQHRLILIGVSISRINTMVMGS
jgi:hypothetical protein